MNYRMFVERHAELGQEVNEQVRRYVLSQYDNPWDMTATDWQNALESVLMANRRIEQEAREIDYVRNDPEHCPWCKSPEIEVITRPDGDDKYLRQEVACHNCHKHWQDVYKLYLIEEIAK